VLPATVNVDLYGPYASTAAIDCSGMPESSTSFTANGDGTDTSAAVTLRAAGYYIFHESIAASSTYAATNTPCTGASETTFAQAVPALSTHVSSAVVRPGSALTDRVTVTGLGRTSVPIAVDLFGPYASRAQVNCAGRPLAARTSAGDVDRRRLHRSADPSVGGPCRHLSHGLVDRRCRAGGHVRHRIDRRARRQRRARGGRLLPARVCDLGHDRRRQHP
jgi:hypothetical protein